MQALQSITRHHLLVNSASFSESDSGSDSPPHSPSSIAFANRSFSTFHSISRRRSSPLLRRSHSCLEGLLQQNGQTSFQRRPSRFDLCRSETSRLANWSEVAVRKTLIRFRNRKSAIKRRWLSSDRRVPSETIQSVLDYGYNVCTSEKTGFLRRLIAVIFCWFYRWVFDMYYCITDDGSERSFSKWTLATIMVTFGAFIVISTGTIAVYNFSYLVLVLVNAGVIYMGFLLSVTIATLGVLAIVNFD